MFSRVRIFLKIHLLAWWWRVGLTLLGTYAGGILITMPAQIRVRPAENANYGAKSNFAQSLITAALNILQPLCKAFELLQLAF